LPPEPEAAPVKASGNGRQAPQPQARAVAKKASAPKAKPATRNGRKSGKRK